MNDTISNIRNRKKDNGKNCSDILPDNNFFIGIGSTLNVFGNYFDYKYCNSEKEADYRAIFSDWMNVGKNIDEARIFHEKNIEAKYVLRSDLDKLKSLIQKLRQLERSRKLQTILSQKTSNKNEENSTDLSKTHLNE